MEHKFLQCFSGFFRFFVFFIISSNFTILMIIGTFFLVPIQFNIPFRYFVYSDDDQYFAFLLPLLINQTLFPSILPIDLPGQMCLRHVIWSCFSCFAELIFFLFYPSYHLHLCLFFQLVCLRRILRFTELELERYNCALL